MVARRTLLGDSWNFDHRLPQAHSCVCRRAQERHERLIPCSASHKRFESAPRNKRESQPSLPANTQTPSFRGTDRHDISICPSKTGPIIKSVSFNTQKPKRRSTESTPRKSRKTPGLTTLPPLGPRLRKSFPLATYKKAQEPNPRKSWSRQGTWQWVHFSYDTWRDWNACVHACVRCSKDGNRGQNFPLPPSGRLSVSRKH